MASPIEKKIIHWMADSGLIFLRISLGIIYFWFGILKFFPDLSPIEDLASQAAVVLTFELISAQAAKVGIATLETLIGIGLLTGKFLRTTLALLIFQLIGAIAPVLFFLKKCLKLSHMHPQ